MQFEGTGASARDIGAEPCDEWEPLDDAVV